MNNIRLSAVAIVAATTLLFSCHGKVLRGHGEKSTTTVGASQSFTALDISANMQANVTINPSAPASVQISGYKNLLDHIKTKTENSKLSITTDLDGGYNLDSHAGTVVTVSVPSLAMLNVAGATDANLHGKLTGPKFELSISGASTIVADDISATDFSAEVTGAANIQVNGGMVQHASYNLSGATKIYAFSLITAETTVEISGAGRAEITANNKLHASISGAGTIHYKGHPEVTKDVSGAGSIKDAN